MDLVVIVHQSQRVRHVLSLVDLLFLVLVHSVLDLIDLLLNVVKRPLLGLLHLYHHLLYLFELLKAIGLHLLKLLLLRDQHLESSVIIESEESMFRLFWWLDLSYVVDPV